VGEISEAVGEPADLFDDQVDGFGTAVGDAAGIEVGEHLLPPSLEGAAEPSHFGDRARREAGDDLLREPPGFGGAGVVDAAELLVALKKWLRAQPQQPQTIAELQALCDQFVAYYNTCRPHRSLNRQTPLAAYQARPKATPSAGKERRASLFPDCGSFKVHPERRGIHVREIPKVFAGVS
jgi:hypothetical protein